MASDSMTNANAVPAFAREIGKKKRANRSAKLKQCKLDARREQWLSQVKNKVEKDANRDSSPPSSLPMAGKRNESLGNLDTSSRTEENEGSSLHDSDSESLMTSPSSTASTNVSRKDCPGTSSSSSSGCFSGSTSEFDEDDGCLDDWEAVADALTADDDRHHVNSESPTPTENTVELTAPLESPNSACTGGILKPEIKGTRPRANTMNCRAWRPDDAFRPQSLPNLSKQLTFPMNAGRHCGGGPVNWGCCAMISQPSSCPICYEDLDITDSSFLPCLCGFRLCLFCHKRILEADGRCPGCRKQYSRVEEEAGVSGGSMPFRLVRSCSMGLRS